MRNRQNTEKVEQRTKMKRDGSDGLRQIETHKYVLRKSRALRPATPLLNVATPVSATPVCRRMSNGRFQDRWKYRRVQKNARDRGRAVAA